MKINNSGGEIPLEHREVCNLSCTLPTRCVDTHEWLDACTYATFYSSTVSLLPTHQPSTNQVVARNRRIGVDIIDYTGWKHDQGLHKVISYMRRGYDLVRAVNRDLNSEAGVPEAIRVTTVKPGGTVPKIAGRTAGIGHPTFHHTLRRVRIAIESPVVDLLKNANIPWHPDSLDPKTLIFEFPILQGPSKPATDVSLWEQAVNLMVMQAEWADNAVSNTLYFKPKWSLIKVHEWQTMNDDFCFLDYDLSEEDSNAIDHMFDDGAKNKTYETDKFKFKANYDKLEVYKFDPNHEEDIIEYVLSSFISKWKSFSLLPHSSTGAYVDMPEEGISKEQYDELVSKINPIDWAQLSGVEAVEEKYCQGASCELNLNH